MTPRTAAPTTAGPAPAHRRMWAPPELCSHSLLVLTEDRLYLAPPALRPNREAAAIGSGVDLDDYLGPLATVVDLATVRRARLDLLANSLVLECAGTGQLTVVFATPKAADACFTKVWRQLGPGAELVPYKRANWSLARAPLLVFAAILVATLILALPLNLVEELSTAQAVATLNVPGEAGAPVRVPKGPLETLAGWLDWRVVCAAGGVAAAATQVWLYRRLSQPPLALEVVRS